MSIYEFHATLMSGERVALSDYRGKVVLIVNTASQCGFSRQFAELQELYDRRREQGLEILGFPCNQFNNKEPGSNLEVRSICEASFGVTFPLFEKIDVRGPAAHPLFAYLTSRAPFQGFDMRTEGGKWMDSFLREKYPEIYEGDGVKWNFSKFLIDRQGEVRARFESTTEPSAIDADLASLL